MRKVYDWPVFEIQRKADARAFAARYAKQTLADLAELEKMQAERRAIKLERTERRARSALYNRMVAI